MTVSSVKSKKPHFYKIRMLFQNVECDIIFPLFSTTKAEPITLIDL
jgi:hypothetical protein